MDPLLLAILFFAVGVVLIAAELLLPTAGVLGVLGVGCFIGAIVSVFIVSPWAGAAVLLALIVLSPIVVSWVLHKWPQTPVGRRIILSDVVPPPPPRDEVRLGMIGVAVTELRPLGECEFDDLRVEAVAEQGMIHAGQSVKVVALSNKRPTVRPVEVPSALEST